MKKTIKLSLPLLSECIISARLTAGVICSILKLDIDQTEDIKLCVSEACNILLNQNFCTAEITFDFEDNLKLEFFGTSCTKGQLSTNDSTDLSVMLLNALSDSAEFFENEGIINKICFEKNLSGGNQ